MSASIHRPQTTSPSARTLSATDFAILGSSRFAYVRAARSEEVAFFCPEAPVLAPGQVVFVLYAADGTPILVTDSHEAAVAAAAQERLEAVSIQ